MILEASQIVTAPIVSAEGKKLAEVDRIVFDGQEAKIAGFQVKQRAVIQRFASLDYNDVLDCERQAVIVDVNQKFSRDLKHFDSLHQHFGAVLGVTAKTESGERLGRVSDLLFEVESGLIVRFCLGQLLKERIVPRQFLVAITPKAIVFKDIVNQPIFDQAATQAAPAI